jgi:predicted short-subunit dehydrogenase-like oxidoreductase (DUF2520 family)
MATRLGVALREAGHDVAQVYGRTASSVEALAVILGAEGVTRPEALEPDMPLYICALKDEALPKVLPLVHFGAGVVVHTAGSLPLEVLKPYTSRCGVFYPMQTLSKARAVSFAEIPIYLEAEDPAVLALLGELAGGLSRKVYTVTSDQRQSLHLAAVFACNFTNHLYAIAESLLTEKGLSFEALLPLIAETAAKVHTLSPKAAQTGPAVRFDRNIIDKHLKQLEGHPEWHTLYEQLSRGIYEMHHSCDTHGL